jgi:hypothetical protein
VTPSNSGGASRSQRRRVFAYLGVTVVLIAGVTSYVTFHRASRAVPELVVGSYSGRYPSLIGFSADAGDIVTKIHWTSWSDSKAVGTGISDIDDCVPDCAEAPIDEVLTRLTLSDPKDGHFTVITERRAGMTTKYPGEVRWPQEAAQNSPGIGSGVNATGRLVGTLEAVGGPAPGTPRSLRGTVFIMTTDGVPVIDVHVGSKGKFSTSVPKGSFKVSGRSPQYEGGKEPCVAPGKVNVLKGKTTKVVVLCQES